jgi:hypothetical protein
MDTLGINTGDMISDSINPNPSTSNGFQQISNVVISQNSTTMKNVYTCTVPTGTILADEDHTVLMATYGSTDYWVVGSLSNESIGE